MNRNKATQRKTAPMKKAVQRQNNSSKKTQGQRLGGVGQQLSPNYGSTIVIENRKPIQRMLSNGNVLVTHREFISKISGSTNFSLSSNPINPGLPSQFNWLYAIANQYESYRFRKLKYMFVNSKTGTFSGEVIMGIDYDASDASPFNEQELQNYWGCKTGVITRPLELMAEIVALNKVPNKFTRIGSLSANQDIKLYDAGNFFIATSDCDDDSTIGRLFVEYEVELKTPQVNGGNILSAKSTSTGTLGQAFPMGDALTVVGSLGITRETTAQFRIDVAGQYLLDIVMTGTTITGTGDIVVSAGTSEMTLISSVINAAATSSKLTYIVKVNSTKDSFFFQSIGAATVTSFIMRLAPYSYANA